jgi:Tfp pilus assembly protein PilO
MKSRDKIVLLISIIFLSVVVLIVFLIVPLFSEIEKYSGEIIIEKRKFIDLDAKVSNLENFKAIKSQIKPNVDKADSLFINKDLPLDFISFLEKTSRDCQLSISMSSSPLNSLQSGTWPFLIFQIRNSGSFPNFLKFLEKIENSNYLIKIQTLSVSGSGGVVTSDLSMKVFTK